MNEIFGRGTHYDFGARYYDARLAKLGFSRDKLAVKYPSQSPYVFGANSPIIFKDSKGYEAIHYTHVITDDKTYVVAVSEKGAFLSLPHGDGMTEWTGYHNYRTDEVIDMRGGGFKVSPRTTQVTSGEIGFGDRFKEHWDNVFKALQPPQVMVFGSGTDYNDWLRNPQVW